MLWRKPPADIAKVGVEGSNPSVCASRALSGPETWVTTSGRGPARRATRQIGEKSLKSRPPQRCDHCLRQQVGGHRLGEAERAVCRGKTADGLGRSDPRRPSGVCEKMTTRWPNGQTALGKPGSKMARSDPGRFLLPGRAHLRLGRRPFLEAGYVEALISGRLATKTPCERGGP